MFLEGDRATVQSIFARLDDDSGFPELCSFGRYRDVLVCCADGAWRFEERLTEVEGLRPGSTDSLRDAMNSEGRHGPGE